MFGRDDLADDVSPVAGTGLELSVKRGWSASGFRGHILGHGRPDKLVVTCRKDGKPHGNPMVPFSDSSTRISEIYPFTGDGAGHTVVGHTTLEQNGGLVGIVQVERRAGEWEFAHVYCNVVKGTVFGEEQYSRYVSAAASAHKPADRVG